jgi:hypothetical protein
MPHGWRSRGASASTGQHVTALHLMEYIWTQDCVEAAWDSPAHALLQHKGRSSRQRLISMFDPVDRCTYAASPRPDNPSDGLLCPHGRRATSRIGNDEEHHAASKPQRFAMILGADDGIFRAGVCALIAACIIVLGARQSFIWASVPAPAGCELKMSPSCSRVGQGISDFRSANGCASRNLEVGQQPFNWLHQCFSNEPNPAWLAWIGFRERVLPCLNLPRPCLSPACMQRLQGPALSPPLRHPPTFTQHARHLMSLGSANSVRIIEGSASAITN